MSGRCFAMILFFFASFFAVFGTTNKKKQNWFACFLCVLLCKWWEGLTRRHHVHLWSFFLKWEFLCSKGNSPFCTLYSWSFKKTLLLGWITLSICIYNLSLIIYQVSIKSVGAFEWRNVCILLCDVYTRIIPFYVCQWYPIGAPRPPIEKSQ